MQMSQHDFKKMQPFYTQSPKWTGQLTDNRRRRDFRSWSRVWISILSLFTLILNIRPKEMSVRVSEAFIRLKNNKANLSQRWQKSLQVFTNQQSGWTEMEKERISSWSEACHVIKHDGGSVMAWACMATSGTRPLDFIDVVTADRSSRMSREVCRAGLCSDSAKCSSHSTSQMMTQIKGNWRVSQAKETGFSSVAKSVAWSEPNTAAFLQAKLNAERLAKKQQLKVPAVKV